MDSIIKLKNVTVIKNGKTILKNISWRIKKNQNWAVIGRNGAGKSFLLNILSANQYPSEGVVEIFGEKFGRTDLRELKKIIGFVSPNFQKDYDSQTKVLNVIYSGFFASNGLFCDVTEEMKYKTQNIVNFLGIDHICDRIYGELSNGEQKKALIARALVSDPDILVFDEVCSGLDIFSREELLKTVDLVLKRGHNIIFVTHHIEEILPSINRVLFIKNGNILKKGKKKKLLTSENLKDVLDIDVKTLYKNGRYFIRPKAGAF